MNFAEFNVDVALSAKPGLHSRHAPNPHNKTRQSFLVRKI